MFTSAPPRHPSPIPHPPRRRRRVPPTDRSRPRAPRTACVRVRTRSNGRHAEHGDGSRRGSRHDWRRPHPPRPRRIGRQRLSRFREGDVVAREVDADRGHGDGERGSRASEERSGSLLAQDLAHDVDRGRVGVALRGTEQTRHRGITRGGTSRGHPGARDIRSGRRGGNAPAGTTCRNGVAADTCVNPCACIRVLTTSRGFTTTALTHAAMPAAPARRRSGTSSDSIADDSRAPPTLGPRRQISSASSGNWKLMISCC